MRKREKQQCAKILTALGEAHDTALRHIREMQFSDARNLLAQCQQLAISMGGMIERTEGSDCAAIHVVEDYCELLYQFTIELTHVEEGAQYAEDPQGQDGREGAEGADSRETLEDNAGKAGASGVQAREDGTNYGVAIWKMLRERERGQGNDYGGKLREAFRCLEDAVNAIPQRLEAVFLPYQATMWDSMESVWRAAEADPDCDTYVIPIPYYEKNPDGSFREVRYDFDRYPADVPVVDFREYDLAERHPDFIFIHTPYDGNNYVTTIAPAFYSEKLSGYTDMLVYIPYFVLDEIRDRSEATLDWMEHFVFMPGVINADLSVVQSDGMKNLYEDVLCRRFGEGTRPFWERKIVGTGSPKYDKALDSKRQEAEVPPAWRKFLYKPDGTRRKVILYNTGVKGLLEQEDKMLRKMRDVFRIFQENAEEICLLWRPHPLIQATLSSMRPQFLQEYLRLVDWYKEHEVGIFDDTADLDRALALSDAYYGDGSSVVQLCRKLGLPVMIQNVDILEGEEEG